MTSKATSLQSQYFKAVSLFMKTHKSNNGLDADKKTKQKQPRFFLQYDFHYLHVMKYALYTFVVFVMHNTSLSIIDGQGQFKVFNEITDKQLSLGILNAKTVVFVLTIFVVQCEKIIERILSKLRL